MLQLHAAACASVVKCPFVHYVSPMFSRSQTLAHADPELWHAISGENARQEAHIELIASENYASPAVMAAQGSQ